MKNALYIQSGGPTAVINASAWGVIEACRDNAGAIGRLFAAEHGIRGVINDRLFDITAEDPAQLALLPRTPSSVFGACRYRIPDRPEGNSDYHRILVTLERRNIGYIFYNGGNGTLRACRDLLAFLADAGRPCRVIAIPKTVDNDIADLDHAPGFPSAAKHVVITVSELAHDIRVYDTGLIMVLEVMGRNTGWLAASTIMCSRASHGPDLVYTPEYRFEDERFVADVERVYARRGKALAVVAEGVRKGDGTYLFEHGGEVFEGKPQKHMGGVTPYLVGLLRRHFTCKIRGIDLGLMQRCGMHTASEIDVREAVTLGREAVLAALAGESGRMVAMERISGKPYSARVVLRGIEAVAGRDGVMPETYITPERNQIRDSFLDYIEPLVGEVPQYASLRLHVV